MSRATPTSMWSRWGPRRRPVLLCSGVRLAAKRWLLGIAFATLLCHSEAAHTMPIVNDSTVIAKPAVNDSTFLVNWEILVSGDATHPKFTMLNAIEERTQFETASLHSLAFPLKDESFKAAILQFLFWFCASYSSLGTDVWHDNQ